jgi:quercetin dioxygenase-like cupin family protein
MPSTIERIGARWFTDTRMRILVSEERQSLIEVKAEHCNMPPLHVHRKEDETFYVLEGRLTIMVGADWIQIGAGEAAFAPRGIPHVYRVDSERARWLAATTSGGFAAFIDELSTPADTDGYAPAELMPSPEALGAAASRHALEILGPPGATP